VGNSLESGIRDRRGRRDPPAGLSSLLGPASILALGIAEH
jgi:hypothetical protein